MVKIEMSRLDSDYHMVALNEFGNVLHIDENKMKGGEGAGFGPMQSLLAAFGGCSTIDVVNILKKQRENLEDLKITITGEREAGAVPSLYISVHAHYILTGNLDKDKVERAIGLSVDKYCSVAETLRRAGAKVTYSFDIVEGKAATVN